MKHGLLTTMQ